MEAAHGCAKVVTVQRLEQCAECGGTGAAKGTNPETCPDCNGTGQVRTQSPDPPLASFSPPGPVSGAAAAER